jgi:hypothetical protein
MSQPTREQAAITLGELAGWSRPPDLADPYVVKLAYREAVRRHHINAGGNREDWDRLSSTMKILEMK